MNKIKPAIWLAAAVHIAAFILMLRKVEPFHSHFYMLAWWTYIAFLTCFNHVRGRNSLFLDTPREGLWIFLLSTPVWLVFEVYNFRLGNWNYVGVPSQAVWRWLGYFFSFGTVLPGIFETEAFLKNLGVARSVRLAPMRLTNSLLVRLVLLGILMMLGSWIRPDWLFPAVWLGLIFALDPFVYVYGEEDESLLGQAEKGEYGLLIRLLLAGMICGLLWEFWNFWAGSKWVYSVPKLGFLKAFEMPFLGFFGFPPFALECYVIYRLFVIFRVGFLTDRKLVSFVLILLGAACCVLAFMGIDRYTVLAFRLYQ
jgi:hypothetical protein